MCGIAGLYRPAADLSAEGLASTAQRMAHALHHRGPDGGGTWHDAGAGIALAHRRLAILDASAAGDQPMASPSGRWVMVFNGEIYNFGELRRELEARGHGFRGRSDTEVLLAAVEEWGLQTVLRRAVGMFALALWDRQERVLCLARDRMGEKPLYYGWTGGAFLFGSELKALQSCERWQAEIDRASVALLLRYNFIPGPHSIYRGVSKLPPGAVLTIDRARYPHEYLTRYWSFEEVVRQSASNRFHGSEAEAADRLEELLQAAVRNQTVADVPVGAFLSGGIDSSTVAAMMQSQSAQPIKTFTMGFEERSYDEAEHASAVARHLGTDHTEFRVTSQDALSIIPRLPALYDEPFADSSQIPTYLLASLARETVTVSLTGDGADELFGGYNRYFLACDIWQRIGWLPVPLRAMLAQAMMSCSPGAWDRALALAADLFPGIGIPVAAGDRIHKLAEIVRARRAEDVYDRLVSYWRRPTSVAWANEPPTMPLSTTRWADLGDYAERMMAADSIMYLPDDILVKVDRACMAASLESRCPFLDHRLVEFARSLPPSLKIREGQGKWLLRQVLQRHVPERLTRRPKMGFGVPLDAWLRGPLRDWAEALLDPSRLRAEGFLNPEPIRRRWQEHISGARNWQYHLWGVLTFQAWLEHERRADVERGVAPALAPRGREKRTRLAALTVRAPAAARGRLLFMVNDARFFLSHRLPLALAARAAGFEVWVATPESTAAKDIVAHGLHFHPVPISRWSSNPWRELKTFIGIARLLRSLRPDMLHAVTIKPVLYGCLAARLTRVPAVVAAIPGMSQIFDRRGWFAGVCRGLVRIGYRRAFGKRNVRVIFQNPDDLRESVAGRIVEPTNAVLIRGSGVDLKRFAASPLPGGVPLVVFVARMLTSKGVVEFVAAAQALRAKGVRARFVLVGDSEDGNPSSVPRERLEAWHRAGVVEWWGHRDDVPEVLAQAYLVCLPSYREGLPKVLLEAAAAARPLITTDVPGCREVVREGKNGLLVPARDSQRLAEAIEGLLGDPARAEVMAARSRQIAEREFGFEKIVRRTLAIYETFSRPRFTVAVPRQVELRPAEAAPNERKAVRLVEAQDHSREVVTPP